MVERTKTYWKYIIRPIEPADTVAVIHTGSLSCNEINIRNVHDAYCQLYHNINTYEAIIQY